MRPDEKTTPLPIIVPPRHSTHISGSQVPGGDQAANIVRGQINNIYDNDPSLTTVAAQTTPSTDASNIPPVQDTRPEKSSTEPDSPYDRTHSTDQHQLQQGAWQKYHSAWQSYYQQYYERYYVGQVHQATQELAAQTPPQNATVQDEISTDEAMYDLREKLISEVKTRSKKVRKSRHFLPIMAATAVMIVFLFLQYNRVLFANVEAYISPGNIDPQNIVIDPSLTADVGPQAKIIIPKINVDVPIIWDAVASDQNSLNRAMDNGVAWFNIPGANSKPGQVGNSVYSGHSSNDWVDKGDYKFIFARLEQLQDGDTIYINYESKRYVYTVTKKEVVKPTDVAALIYPVDKPIITLVTCVPLGTALNRLLVTATQVSPDPKLATEQPKGTAGSSAVRMPSNSPSFLQRIFGGNN